MAQIEIGQFYSYTNKYNYTSVVRVERATEKSVFVRALVKGVLLSEHREGINNFKKYKLCQDVASR